MYGEMKLKTVLTFNVSTLCIFYFYIMKWTSTDIKYLQDNYPDCKTVELVSILKRSAGAIQAKAFVLRLNKSEEFIKSKKSGRLDGSQGKEFWYKKGQQPKNVLYDGAVRKRRCAGAEYYFIRIASCKWEFYHRWLWEQHHGKIPKSYVVVFRDGNKLNCTIENLACMSKSEEYNRGDTRKINSETHKHSWQRAKIRNKAVLPLVNGYGKLIENGKYKI